MKGMLILIKVLLVEDEISTRKLLNIIVNWEEFHMYICGEASNGREALFKIEKDHPDLVVTDIRMPILDGIALAKEIQKRYPDIKVMIITAYDDFSYAQDALRIGVVDFILKPLKRQEVKEALIRVGMQFHTDPEGKEDVIKCVQEYLHEHFAESTLSLAAVAEKFYLNSSYLSRIFKERTGTTLVEYLNKIRIHHACRYLDAGGWKIYEIAEKVGIPNADYFGRCFRKIMGISAKEYCNGKKSE